MVKSLTSAYLDALRFTREDASTLRSLGEARGKQDLFMEQAPEQLETLRRTAIIQSSESSNRIEGVTAAAGRVAELVLHPSTPPRDRSEQEIAGYRDVLNTIHESHEHIAFTASVVLQFHAQLFRYHSRGGGRWKSTDNEILDIEPTAALVFAFVRPPQWPHRAPWSPSSRDIESLSPRVVTP